MPDVYFSQKNLIQIFHVFDGIFDKGGARKKQQKNTRRYLARGEEVEENWIVKIGVSQENGLA